MPLFYSSTLISYSNYTISKSQKEPNASSFGFFQMIYIKYYSLLNRAEMEITMENNKLKVIVCDLDGTRYEDTHHFEYYAKQLQHKLPTEKHEAFWKDYQS